MMWMALITVNAIPHVVIITAVFWIGCGFRMANGALEDRIVAGIRMAGSANAVSPAMVQWE
jgi:hypothetical protein